MIDHRDSFVHKTLTLTSIPFIAFSSLTHQVHQQTVLRVKTLFFICEYIALTYISWEFTRSCL